jgi:hypothetical protein
MKENKMPQTMRFIFWVMYCWSGLTGGRAKLAQLPGVEE